MSGIITPTGEMVPACLGTAWEFSKDAKIEQIEEGNQVTIIVPMMQRSLGGFFHPGQPGVAPIYPGLLLQFGMLPWPPPPDAPEPPGPGEPGFPPEVPEPPEPEPEPLSVSIVGPSSVLKTSSYFDDVVGIWSVRYTPRRFPIVYWVTWSCTLTPVNGRNEIHRTAWSGGTKPALVESTHLRLAGHNFLNMRLTDVRMFTLSVSVRLADSNNLSNPSDEVYTASMQIEGRTSTYWQG